MDQKTFRNDIMLRFLYAPPSNEEFTDHEQKEAARLAKALLDLSAFRDFIRKNTSKVRVLRSQIPDKEKERRVFRAFTIEFVKQMLAEQKDLVRVIVASSSEFDASCSTGQPYMLRQLIYQLILKYVKNSGSKDVPDWIHKNDFASTKENFKMAIGRFNDYDTAPERSWGGTLYIIINGLGDYQANSPEETLFLGNIHQTIAEVTKESNFKVKCLFTPPELLAGGQHTWFDPSRYIAVPPLDGDVRNGAEELTEYMKAISRLVKKPTFGDRRIM